MSVVDRPSSARLIRIFVSSPTDVADERRALDEVVARINRTDGEPRGLRLETIRWERDVTPLVGASPQAVIDELSPHCDIFLGIMSARFGGDSLRDSGTEAECRDALDRWQRVGRPWILFYFDDEPELGHTPPQIEEYLKVVRFRAELQSKGIVGTYRGLDGPTGFSSVVDEHLRAVLYRVVSDGKNGPGTAAPAPPSIPSTYLEWIRLRCSTVELLGLRTRHGQSVKLTHVYVPLSTSADSSKDTNPSAATFESRTLLLERLGSSSLYVPGDPGSGKSTFCRWLAWLAAGGDMPGLDVETVDEIREVIPATIQNRLPILISLRHFWQGLPRQNSAGAFLRKDLESAIALWIEHLGAGGFTSGNVLAHLERGSSLIIFDGVDEVPSWAKVALLSGLCDAIPTWHERGHRVLITSRQYGLTQNEVAQLSLPVAPVRPLHGLLQRLLVRRWFRILEDVPSTSAIASADLLQQISRQGWLAEFASNPLLLTAICIVYSQGKRLPEDRYDLYDEIINTVLHGRIEDPSRRALVRGRLAAVAHGMHSGIGLNDSRIVPQAQVTNEEIDRIIGAWQQRASWTEAHARGVYEDRQELVIHSGLLLPQDQNRNAFYHLSIQEFLAAQQIAETDDGRLATVFAERSRYPEWRPTLAFLFGRVLTASVSPEPAVRLLTTIVTGRSFDIGLQLVAADALEILLKRGLRLSRDVEDAYIRAVLPTIGVGERARDRCRLADSLALLGDPRFRKDAWYLPDDAMLGFVSIDAGVFSMGSDPVQDSDGDELERPAHDLHLPTFLIGRFPVTVAQYDAFLDATAADSEERPGRSDSTGLSNHPAVWVSWHDAARYCRWLTMVLKESPVTPAPLARLLRSGQEGHLWRAMLPSEAEWEKAARSSDRRLYPWGMQPDPDKANYDSYIGGTSAVGCFGGGASPYGVEELSGNVWEWTRTRYQAGIWTYPYKIDDRRERLTAQSGDRIMRGGSFSEGPRKIRAAYRQIMNPDAQFDDVGFRIAISRYSYHQR